MSHLDSTGRPIGQAQQSLNPLDYPEYRVCVFGSRQLDRSFANWVIEKILVFMHRVPADKPILFISGDAHSGPDRIVKEFAKTYCYPCLLMPAEWEKYEKALTKRKKNPAGMIRNTEMADISLQAIGFWDGQSPGTANMIELVANHENRIHCVFYGSTEPAQRKIVQLTLKDSRYRKYEKPDVYEEMTLENEEML